MRAKSALQPGLGELRQDAGDGQQCVQVAGGWGSD